MSRAITVRQAVKEAEERDQLARRRKAADLCEACGEPFTVEHECPPEHVARCFEEVIIVY
jgi:hypothetical protein